MRHKLFTLAAGLFLLAGCRSDPLDRLPDEPDELTLLSLDGPAVFRNDGRPFTPADGRGELLFGYPVLGKVMVTDLDHRRAVVAAVREGAKYKGSMATCFIPRHAVRTVKNGHVVNVVICYECYGYRVYTGDGTAADVNGGPMSADGRPLLDKILTDAGVPLAPKVSN